MQLRIDGGLVVREAAGLSRSEGIQPGDVIIAVNDVKLDSVDDFAHALSLRSRREPGSAGDARHACDLCLRPGSHLQ
ncbi:PDZ domain-containing protein [Polaromonas sp. P1(28)-13]|nr:PDZ domain-containing protein [Polaromonas sp. P1(28)-13]